MYTCSNCGFESEELKNLETRQYNFVNGECRSCYYSKWAKHISDSPFNTTHSEDMHYQEVNYNPRRVQDILCNSSIF